MSRFDESLYMRERHRGFSIRRREQGVGSNADLALVNLDDEAEIKSDDLLYHHRQSPYVGRRVRAAVQRTILRGRTIFQSGKITGEPSGRLVRPVRQT